jgi:hypothetical protein
MAIDHTNLSTDDVRQGESGHGVRYMLGYGIAFAVMALGFTVLFLR